MIYRPKERPESRAAARATRELAAVLVVLSLFAALILQFSCSGADTARSRWFCPNNARMARLVEPTPSAEPDAPTPAPGSGVFSSSEIGAGGRGPSVTPTSVYPPPSAFPTDDYGAPEPAFITPDVRGFDEVIDLPTPAAPPFGGIVNEAPTPTMSERLATRAAARGEAPTATPSPTGEGVLVDPLFGTPTAPPSPSYP